MRDLACPVCNANQWSPWLSGVIDYITDETFDLLCCGRCGLVVTHPLPMGPGELDRYYPPRYRTDRQKQTGAWRVRRRAAMLEKQFPAGFRGRLLDLGCGTGAFATEMQQRGWAVAVTELNDAVLEQMRARGMEAKRPDEAMRDGFADGNFDAITAWHVLEHVPDPRRIAQWSRENLAPAGAFQATVPNLASWQAQRFGRYWLHLDVPRHWYHFTPQTLRALLDRAGLEIVATSTVAAEYDVFGVVQSALNVISSRPNVMFEMLTTRQKLPLPAWDVVLAYVLGPWLGIYATGHSIAAGLSGAGATLTVTCKATGGASVSPS